MVRGITRTSVSFGAGLVLLCGLTALCSRGVQPVWVFAGFLLLPCLLFALVKFPAIFIVPLLFMTRGLKLPFNPFRRAFDPPALSLGVGLLCLAIFFRLLKYSNQRKSRWLSELFKNQGKGIAIYFLFAAVVAVSYLWTRAPNYGGDKLVSFLTVGTLAFLAPFVLMIDERDFRIFALFTVAFAVFVSLGRIAAGSQGVYGAHEEVTHIGVGQLIGMGILFALTVRLSESRWVRYALFLALPLLAAGLIAAETRDALFSLVLVLIGMSFARRKATSLISPLTALSGVALIVVVLLVFPDRWFKAEAAAKFRAKSIEVVNMLQGKSTDKGSGGRRLVFYKAAMEGIEQKPLAGWGVGGWATYYWHNDEWEYPHNVLLEVGVEQGLIGISAFFAFLVVSLKAAKKAFDESSGRFAFVLPTIAYCLLLVTASGDIDDSRFVYTSCALAFVACRTIDSNRQKEAPQQDVAAG